MAGGGLIATADVSRIEAPVTFRAYLMCAFASFGGIFFGYDSGYISGVMGMKYFIRLYTGLPIPGPDASDEEITAFALPAHTKSTITSVLSAGTFFGALIAGDLSDWFGRRTTIIAGMSLLSLFQIGGWQKILTNISLQVAASLFSVSFSKLPRRALVFWLPVVLLQVLAWDLSLPLSFYTCPRLHPRRFAEPSCQAISSVSRLASSLPLVLIMVPKTVSIPAHTESQLPFKCSGL